MIVPRRCGVRVAALMRAALAGVIAAAIAAPLTLATTATAAPTWLPPVTVGEAGSFSEGLPVAAMDARGDTFIAWPHREGSNWSLELATRPAGGSWQPPTVFPTSTSSVFLQQIAADANGDEVVTWESFDGTNTAIYASYLPAGGGWQAPVKLAEEVGSSTILPVRVAIDDHGDALAVWSTNSTGTVMSSLKPAGAGWQLATAVAPGPGVGFQPAVAMDAAGDAVAVWRHRAGAGKELIEAAARPAGGGWGAVAPVSTEAPEISAVNAYPAVVSDAAGDAFAAFVRSDGSNAIVDAAELPRGGSWQVPAELSAPLQDAQAPQIAGDERGDAAVAWQRSNGANVIAQGSFKPAGGSWGPATDLSEAGVNASGVAVAMGAAGNAFALWRSKGSNTRIGGSIGGNAGWQAPVFISAPGQDSYYPAVAADGQGDALAMWEREGTWQVEASAYDGAGPALNGLAIPASGSVGVPVAFGVSPLDVFSALGATTWSFGDGSGGAGASLSHTYTAAGSYHATVTGSDVLGNTTTASGTIAIGAAAPAAKPSPPVISGLRQSAARWREGSRLARISRRGARVPIGTTFSFKLDQAAALRLAFAQRVPGRLAGRNCVAQSHRNARHRACMRTLVRGTLALSGHAGLDKVSFQGRVSRTRKLRPGRYSLVLGASNAGGAAAPRSIGFTIVR